MGTLATPTTTMGTLATPPATMGTLATPPTTMGTPTITPPDRYQQQLAAQTELAAAPPRTNQR